MNESPLPSAAGLAGVVDEHLRWIGQWHRAAFFNQGDGVVLPVPTAFPAWVRGASGSELADQPAIDRLISLHDQMHRMARLVHMRACEGQPPSLAAYEAVIEKFDEFMGLLRRVERAFSVAGSGIDPLTGLRNRTGLREEMEREANRYRRTGRPFCVALCDLDKFKSVNDTYGHEAGDRVLMAAAGAINRGIRSFDEAFRLGGEEILILLKDATVMDGYAVVERLRQDMEALPVAIGGGRTIHFTASFGLAEAQPDGDPEDLVAEADAALYTAKHQGRNRVVSAGAPPRVAGLP
ncbi:diguanylate cyclase [Nitrospirillum pindoramense]|uniref:diguanylate cyclase n=1 Tax=Nitrospirillum amazonense TaxID=28077 RepID=A0A560GWB1_9PROT|nr:diguanylate cyclase [Nitrospirillum amazonense]TWB38091.1 diguanylate cyclase (GGDEF)-like protein [Nitrospirillum amazonense]